MIRRWYWRYQGIVLRQLPYPWPVAATGYMLDTTDAVLETLAAFQYRQIDSGKLPEVFVQQTAG